MLGRICVYLYTLGSAWAYLALPDREWSEGVKNRARPLLETGSSLQSEMSAAEAVL